MEDGDGVGENVLHGIVGTAPTPAPLDSIYPRPRPLLNPTELRR